MMEDRQHLGIDIWEQDNCIRVFAGDPLMGGAWLNRQQVQDLVSWLQQWLDEVAAQNLHR